MDINHSLKTLSDEWNIRKCNNALKILSKGWPLCSGLTDDWANLLECLEELLVHAKDELRDEENSQVEKMIILIRESL